MLARWQKVRQLSAMRPGMGGISVVLRAMSELSLPLRDTKEATISLWCWGRRGKAVSISHMSDTSNVHQSINGSYKRQADHKMTSQVMDSSKSPSTHLVHIVVVVAAYALPRPPAHRQIP